MYDLVCPSLPAPAALLRRIEPPDARVRPDPILLSMAGFSARSHVVVFVPGALELACALLNRGVSEVTMMRPDDGHLVVDADLAIVPQVASTAFLVQAVRCARRILAAQGSVIIHLGQDASGELAACARTSLGRSGFRVLRTRIAGGRVFLAAELVVQGHLACA